MWEEGNLFLVDELDGRLVGWVTCFRAQQEFLRHTIEFGMGAVCGYRGVGIGAALMEYALPLPSAGRSEVEI